MEVAVQQVPPAGAMSFVEEYPGGTLSARSVCVEVSVTCPRPALAPRNGKKLKT
jgi:hypothetical protein